MTAPNLAPETAPVKLQPLFIDDSQLCARWHMVKVSLWRLRKRDPRCPRPIKGLTWCNLTPLAEVEAYEQLLLAERDAAAQKTRPPLQSPAYYPAKMPDRLPAGRIIVHNHVRPPAQHQGQRGFRFWIAEPDDRYVPCFCGWAPHLGKHYRVDREPG